MTCGKKQDLRSPPREEEGRVPEMAEASGVAGTRVSLCGKREAETRPLRRWPREPCHFWDRRFIPVNGSWFLETDVALVDTTARSSVLLFFFHKYVSLNAHDRRDLEIKYKIVFYGLERLNLLPTLQQMKIVAF